MNDPSPPPAPHPDVPFEQLWRQQALGELLSKVNDRGAMLVSGGELLRLSGAGSVSSRLLRLLGEAWEGLGLPLSEFNVIKTPWQGNFVLLRAKPGQILLSHGGIGSPSQPD